MNSSALQLLKQLPGGIILLNNRYQLTFVNSFVCQHSGLPERDLLGHDFFQLFPEVPKAWFCRKVTEVLTQQQAQQISWQQRLYLLKFPRQAATETMAMAQNISLLPLPQREGSALAIWIEDATETARYHAQLVLSTQQLKRHNRFDSLTELPNRQYWLQQLQLELARAERYERPLAVLLFELDRFKALNDQYGHQFGDSVLQSLARQCGALLRDNDLLARLGGAEFAVLLPDTELAGALEVTNRLRASLAQQGITEQLPPVKLSISSGVSTFTAGVSADTLLQQAEQALYQAKCAGKNQTSIWRDSSKAS